MAPEGAYTATLNCRTTDGVFTRARQPATSFVLDVTPPTGTITLSSALFSPIESSDNDHAEAGRKLEGGEDRQLDHGHLRPGGKRLQDLLGKVAREHGRLERQGHQRGDGPVRGRLPGCGEDAGPVRQLGRPKTTVPVDILVEKTKTGYRILASRIFFKAFTADYKDVPPETLRSRTPRGWTQLAAKLAKFPGYKIRIVGHAVMINWDNPAAGREEQRAILIPLSKARADAIEAALADRGLDKGRFTTDGVGASDQLVPDSDYKDRWQNRRVALFLDKE